MKLKPKKTKFRVGKVRGGKKPTPDSSYFDNGGKNNFLLPPVNETIHEVCRRIRKAGLVHEFKYGDRFFLATDKDFEVIDPEWIVYPEKRIANENPELVISCQERGVWYPRLEEVFQILKDGYGFYPTCVSQARTLQNYAVAFSKLQMKPKMKLLGVTQQKSLSLEVAVLRCLEAVVVGNVTDKWHIW